MTKLKVAVIFGGKSPEHEVSIITAVQAMKSIPSTYVVIPIYVSKTGKIFSGDILKSIGIYSNMSRLEKTATEIYLPTFPSLIPVKSKLFSNSNQPFDIIFPCFHGGIGEGGWIQGLAEFYNIPIVGTGLTGATLGMDKIAMKSVFDGADIKQASYIWFYRQDWYSKQATFTKKITSHLTFPIFVKPSRGGSSIGTSKTKNNKELIQAIDLAATMDTRIVVEEGIEKAREINISVLGNAGNNLEFSVCEEVFHEGSDFLEFKDKYLPSDGQSEGMASTDRIIPAKIDGKIVNKIRQISTIIFNTLDCSGLVRLDFLLKGQEVYCLEINTIPGSLSFYLWDKSGYPYPKLLQRLIELSIEKHNDSKKTLTDYNSPILTSISKGGKLGTKLQD